MTPEVEQDLRKEIERLKAELAEQQTYSAKVVERREQLASDNARLLRELAEKSEQVLRAKDRYEKAEVQLAACGAAALGWAGDPPPQKGDYGWSASFQDVLDLRTKLERLREALTDLRKSFIEAGYREQFWAVRDIDAALHPSPSQPESLHQRLSAQHDVGCAFLNEGGPCGCTSPSKEQG